jgi:hypothetical protein
VPETVENGKGLTGNQGPQRAERWWRRRLRGKEENSKYIA